MLDSAIEEQDRLLADLLARIVDRYAPAEVWLFGSRFRGDHHRLSDWDILVLVDDHAPDEVFDPHLAWETYRDSGIPAHVVVESVSDFVNSLDVPNTLAMEIRNERRLLYRRT